MNSKHNNNIKNSIKKISVLIIIIIMLSVIFYIFTTNVSAATSSKLKASILRYEPDPAEQGNTFDVWVQLSNRGTKIDNVAIRFVPEYPFSQSEFEDGDGEETDEIDVGTIAAIEDKVVKFSIFVDPNAPNTEKDITFAYRHSGSDEWILLESPILIQTQDSVLIIDDYKVSPNPVIPGQIVNVELVLRNAGRIAVKNIDLELGIEENHFSSIGSGNRKRIPYIQAGESEKISLQLASDTSTEVKIYSIPISLTYSDEKNKEYSSTSKISLQVNAEPEISVTVDETKFAGRKKPGIASVKVVNRGIVDLKYLSVKILESKDYEILSSGNEEYIGNLDSDDFETVDFTVKPKTKEPKLSLELNFKDPYNENFEQKYEIPLKIITEKDLGKNRSIWPALIIILFVVCGVYYWYRKRSKYKK